MATEVDAKLKLYREIQTGTISITLLESSLIDFIFIDIQKLFTQKQQALSQFNENTLVKGVTALTSIIFIIYNDCILIFILGIRFIRRGCSNL